MARPGARAPPSTRDGASAPGALLRARACAVSVAAAALLAVIGITANRTHHAQMPDSLLAAPVAAQRLAATSDVTSAVKAIHQRLVEDKLAAAALTRLATDEAMLVSADAGAEQAWARLARVCSVPERKAINPTQ